MAKQPPQPSEKALNPPKGQCRQCWFHAYAPRTAHWGLTWTEPCEACLSHVGGCPESMIVR
jgi:hypothetical protein